MSRKSLILCVVALVAGLVVGCGPSESEQQRDQFDAAVHEVEEATGAFYLLGGGSTTDQVRSVTERLTVAWRKAEDAGEGLEGIDLAGASAAHDALVEAVGGVPSDTADGEAFKVAMPLLEAFKAEVEKAHQSGGFHG